MQNGAWQGWAAVGSYIAQRAVLDLGKKILLCTETSQNLNSNLDFISEHPVASCLIRKENYVFMLSLAKMIYFS